jgi:poly-gamma-glutamate synthesis protein (capsule biosynthesis protein)
VWRGEYFSAEWNITAMLRQSKWMTIILLTGIVVILPVSLIYQKKCMGERKVSTVKPEKRKKVNVRIFLSGDVMTGRGIDQVLPDPVNPVIYEPYMKSASGYVALAEEIHGHIPKPVSYEYIWGDTLAELQRFSPHLRIINLETSITRRASYWPGKGIHYRMSPGNINCLSAAKIDYCSLANNHILDWDYEGLRETLESLDGAGIGRGGAGMNIREAKKPFIHTIKGKGRIIILSYGMETSGIPFQWAAGKDRPGVNLLKDFSGGAISNIKKIIKKIEREDDIILFSIHWGGNWGYEIPQDQRDFAHRLIDEAGIDIVHGHSSHHFKGIEVYKNRAIIYGAGDFINDYEGISGKEEYRGDLSLIYLLTLDPESGELVEMRLVPMQMKRFRLNNAESGDVSWVVEKLNSEGKRFGTGVEMLKEKGLRLIWED